VESTEVTDAVPGRALAFLGVTAVPRPTFEAGWIEKDKRGGEEGRGGRMKTGQRVRRIESGEKMQLIRMRE
jgi:hypothetical protein